MTKPTTASRRAKSSGAISVRTTSAGRARYEARVSLTHPGTGKRRQVGKTFSVRADAQRWLTAQLASVDGGTFSEDYQLTVQGWLTRWLAAKDRELRPSTRSAYQTIIQRHVSPRLGGTKLAELKPSHLSEAYGAIMADSEGKGRSQVGPATVQRINAVLRSALSDAMRDGYVSRNVASLVRLPKVSKPQQKWWEVSHVRTFTEYTRGDRHQALWLLLLRCGLRRGEALGLCWEDVMLDAADGTWPHARITRQVLAVGSKILRGDPKTDSGRRVVVLDPVTIVALKAWRKVQAAERLAAGLAWGGDPEIFTNTVGRVTDPAWVTKRFRTLAQEAGLPIIRLHDARHTAASQWLAAGVPLKDVSGLLGHSSISITADTYGHVLDDSRQAAARAMAARLDG